MIYTCDDMLVIEAEASRRSSRAYNSAAGATTDAIHPLLHYVHTSTHHYIFSTNVCVAVAVRTHRSNVNDASFSSPSSTSFATLFINNNWRKKTILSFVRVFVCVLKRRNLSRPVSYLLHHRVKHRAIANDAPVLVINVCANLAHITNVVLSFVIIARYI